MVWSVGVVGAGTMGVGIAYVFAAAGCETTVVEPDAVRAGELRGVLAEASANGLKRGKLDRGRAEALPESVRSVRSVGELPAAVDLVVETVPEDFDLKREVLARIEERSPALLATNTSSMSIDRLAEGLRRPERFLGLHFFNPVWSIPMVEIVRGAHTADDALALARHAAELIGKETIVVRDVPGFATSRLDVIASLEAMRMLEDGVTTAEEIDRAAVLAYRHPVGPLRLSDLVGLDVRLDIARNLTKTYGARYEPPGILVAKVRAGELGRKSGRGFFDWT